MVASGVVPTADGRTRKATVPEEKRPKSVMWLTEDNRPTRTRPGQHQLFGIRDVGATPSRTRDA